MSKEELKKECEVTYIPKNSNTYEDRELGIIKSWNNRHVFVKYGRNENVIATDLQDLQVGDHTFFCEEEHHSLSENYDRCKKQCNNCKP